jgi:UDP-N-acetylglucosamine--N-acetylmuramyl-(pentapeptide) pyrophosphoryl-undecaprenol N-acetylglucosamine transferase
MRIILVGGGTGGPVMPLIAVQQKISADYPDAEFLFIGTTNGMEKDFVKKYKIPFVSIPAGKLRRYFSFRNLVTPFQVFAGFIKSLSIIRSYRPDVIFSAGGFVAVPVVMAAFILRKKIVLHQQDVVPSLTNQILAPLATKITVSFEGSVKDFRVSSGLFLTDQNKNPENQKVIWTGNPVREELILNNPDLVEIKKKFGIHDEQLVILFLGGATGALALNQILLEALPDLTKFSHIIHATGRGKEIVFTSPNYHPYEFLPHLQEAYAIADLVISRAGLSTITELAVLKKVSIIIPMPDSHQEKNAWVLDQKEAALCLDQKSLTAADLISLVRKIMYDADWQRQLQENISKLMPRDAARRIAKVIENLCQ